MSTYTPIASLTLSSAQSSVTFSGIPQTYTDLVLVTNWASSNSLSFLYIQFNSDTGSNYSFTELYGNGSAAGSYRESNQSIPWVSSNVGVPSTIKANTIMNFMNYSNSTTYKTWIARMNSVDAPSYPGTAASVGLWRSTNAITTITLKNRTSGVDYNFASGSTFNLYGIDAQASAQAKATGGDSIYRDASYWYHVFNKSGTFTPAQSLSNVDYLVVAGGGGGYVQGGGAGGYRTSAGTSGANSSAESKISLSSGIPYTVTIGAGGIQGNRGVGGNGSDSSISGSGLTTITSTGGGGISSGGLNGNTGGSGGGAFNFGTAGSGTPNQGYAGGACPTGNAGGGGGGAGAVGTAGSGSSGGNGGNGLASSITGSSVTYAGGGAGYGPGSSGTAGTGGGGTAGAASPTSDGQTNRGGGGGGNNAGNGGKGGSGIVVIRYAV